MNNTAIANDSALDQELETFLVWFCQQPEIPENERLYFMEHVQSVGGIDEQAAQFIEDNLNMIEMIRQAKVSATEEKTKTLLGCMNGEKLPKQSAKNRMAEITGAYLTEISENAVNKVKAHDLAENKAEETNQHDVELDAVEALKKSL